MLGFLWFFTTCKEQPGAVADAELLRRHIQGDPEAFAALIRRYQDPLFGFLARYCGDRALAEDVFQETFLQVHQSAGMFDTSRPFRPWLYTVAVNKARDAMRKKSRHTTSPLDANISRSDGSESTFAELMPSNIPSPDEISSNLETRSAVKRMVDEMPETLRKVLILSYFQELPQKEIAEILSVPVGTVKSRLHAAVQQFAEKWKAWNARQNRHATESEANDASD